MKTHRKIINDVSKLHEMDDPEEILYNIKKRNNENVTIRQTNWIRKTNYKEVEQNQPTWYSHV